MAEAKCDGLGLTNQVLDRLEFIKHEEEPEEIDEKKKGADWVFELETEERDKDVYFTYVNQNREVMPANS